MPLLRIPTKDMSLAEWREMRRTGIGGSEAASVLGMNPFSSPLYVYLDKLGLLPEKDETEAMRQGRDLEQYVADRFSKSTGKKTRRLNQMLRNTDRDWMLANIDRDVVGEDAGLECKTTSVYNRTEFDQGDIPASMYWQCVAYMAVTGCSKWYLAVLVLNSAFHVFEIARNEDHIKMLVEAEREFWYEHVLKGIPPLPSGSDQDDDLIPIIIGGGTNGDVIDLSTLDNDIGTMQTIKASMDALDKQHKAIRQRVMMAMGEYQEGHTDRFRVTYKPHTTSRVDTAAMRKEHPAIVAAYTSATEVRPLKVKGA